MTPDCRGYDGRLDAEQVPLEWKEIQKLEASLPSSPHLARAFAELRHSRRRAASDDDIARLRNRIREHEQESDAWAAAGKRMRAEADKQIAQLRRDFEATLERAAELAKRVSELEQRPLITADNSAELRRVRTIIQRLPHREHGAWWDPLDGCIAALDHVIGDRP